MFVACCDIDYENVFYLYIIHLRESHGAETRHKKSDISVPSIVSIMALKQSLLTPKDMEVRSEVNTLKLDQGPASFFRLYAVCLYLIYANLALSCIALHHMQSDLNYAF